jgi:RHS repeat-associated protein
VHGDGRRRSRGREQELRFQGQQEDGETGLFYNRFRYYDPDAGLYLSPDPIGLAGGLRPFGYVPNPTGWIDPLGLAPYTVKPYGEQESPRNPTGYEAHHIIQDKWAKANVPGYDRNDGPSIMLPKSDHDVTKGEQTRRRCARVSAGGGAFSSSLREEFDNAAGDMDKAGVPEDAKRRAIKTSYKHFYP